MPWLAVIIRRSFALCLASGLAASGSFSLA
jgi:hypothetical protein